MLPRITKRGSYNCLDNFTSEIILDNSTSKQSFKDRFTNISGRRMFGGH